MREGLSSTLLAGAFSMRPRVSSWLGAELLAEDIPVLGGSLSVNGEQEIPERLTFTVPAYADRRSWVPGEQTDHPLASFGQVVDLDMDVTTPLANEATRTRIGRYRIQSWDHNEAAGTVNVECWGLLAFVAGAKFITPTSPRPGGTLASEFTRLLPDSLGVEFEFDDTLRNRACPQSMQWQKDRLGALYEITDAWPARLRVDQNGVLRVLKPLPEAVTPVLHLRDGERGTLVSAPTGAGRDGIYNVVVATARSTDAAAPREYVAVARVQSGPLLPETYGFEVREFSSPLLTTLGQAQSAARTILASSTRKAVTQTVTCVPDPRIELDDALRITRAGQDRYGVVIGYSLPLVSGDMQITVGVR